MGVGVSAHPGSEQQTGEGAVGANENRQGGGGGKKKCRSERTSPLITLSLHNRQGESTRIIKLMVWLFVCCCGSVFFFLSNVFIVFFSSLPLLLLHFPPPQTL